MRTQQIKVKHLFIAGVLFAAPLFYLGCGGAGNPAASSTAGTTTGGGGVSSGKGVTVSGSVAVPASTSTSVSVGSSLSKEGVSKSVAKGDSEFVTVYKSAADVLVNSGSVTAKRLDGTVLGKGKITDGKITGLLVDPAQLDSTSQAVLSVDGKSITSLVDLTGKKVGESADAGTVNSDSSLVVQQIYYQADPTATPDNPATIAQKIASGEINPLALFRTFKSTLDGSSSAGSSNASSAMKAMSIAWRAALANGAPKFSDLNSAFQGGSIINTWKGFDSSLSGVDMGTAMTQMQGFMPACAKTFSDPATFAKYQLAGDSGWAASGQYFGNQTKSDFDNAIAKPEIFQGFLSQKADSFTKGDTTAFDSMKKAGVARVLGQFAGKGNAADLKGKYDLLEQLIESQKSKFDSLDSSKFASMGEAIFNQMQAASSTTQVALLKADPGSFMSRIFDNPAAYTGATGTAVFSNQFTTYVQNPTAFTDVRSKSCSSDITCTTPGFRCSSGNMCQDCSTSSKPFACPCTSSSDCASNTCTSLFCSMPLNLAGVDLFKVVWKGPGQSCTTTSQCYPPLSCSAGVCSSYSNWGGITAASGLQQAAAGDGQVTLNWTTSSGATGYKIYRSLTSTGSYTLLATLGVVSTYNDTGLSNGTPYFYKISSFTPTGESAPSNFMSAVPVPGAGSVAAVAGNAQVALSWAAAAGATGYNVYRALASGGPYTLVATLGNVTSYTNTALSNGTLYFYKISSLASGAESNLSTVVSGTPNQKIAFESTRKLDGTDVNSSVSNIWIMNGDGSGLAPLTSITASSADSFNPQFSPNGAKIVYNSWRRLDGTDAFGTSNIWVMNANGTGTTPLTSMTVPGGWSQNPQFSPDGTKIVYSSGRSLDGTNASNSGDNIWVMNADGSGSTALTSITAGASSQNPQFSPNGAKIVYSSARKLDGTNAGGTTYNIWIMNADGSGSTPLTSLTAVAYSQNPQFSPDGAKIVYQSARKLDGTNAVNGNNNNNNIWVMNADGSGSAALTSITAGGASSQNPQFSPNGAKIVYRSARKLDGTDAANTNNVANIWVMNADGSVPTPLTSITASSADSLNPQFSPNGAKIVYRSARKLDGTDAANTGSNIWVVNVDGTGAAPLTSLSSGATAGVLVVK